MDVTESKPWLILTKRFGDDIHDPSGNDLATAINELYQENLNGITEADYVEHPNACLRYGFDEGPMYVLDVYRSGRIIFGQWADQDYEAELAPETTIEDVAEERALELWTWLADGDVGRIKTSIARQT